MSASLEVLTRLMKGEPNDESSVNCIGNIVSNKTERNIKSYCVSIYALFSPYIDCTKISFESLRQAIQLIEKGQGITNQEKTAHMVYDAFKRMNDKSVIPAHEIIETIDALKLYASEVEIEAGALTDPFLTAKNRTTLEAFLNLIERRCTLIRALEINSISEYCNYLTSKYRAAFEQHVDSLDLITVKLGVLSSARFDLIKAIIFASLVRVVHAQLDGSEMHELAHSILYGQDLEELDERLNEFTSTVTLRGRK